MPCKEVCVCNQSRYLSRKNCYTDCLQLPTTNLCDHCLAIERQHQWSNVSGSWHFRACFGACCKHAWVPLHDWVMLPKIVLTKANIVRIYRYRHRHRHRCRYHSEPRARHRNNNSSKDASNKGLKPRGQIRPQTCCRSCSLSIAWNFISILPDYLIVAVVVVIVLVVLILLQIQTWIAGCSCSQHLNVLPSLPRAAATCFPPPL